MERVREGDIQIAGRCCYCYKVIYLFHHRYQMHYTTKSNATPLSFSLMHCLERGRVEGRKVYYCSVHCWQSLPLAEVMAQSREELTSAAVCTPWWEKLSRLIIHHRWWQRIGCLSIKRLLNAC